MIRNLKTKTGLVVLFLGIVIGFFLRDLFREEEVAAKIVTIKSRNLSYQVATRAETVGEVLGEQIGEPSTSSGNKENYSLSEPEASRRVTYGMLIDLKRSATITLTDGGDSRQVTTLAETVGDLLNLEKVGLAATDQVAPPLESYLAEGLQIVIDRIVDLEVTERNEISFASEIRYDATAYYGSETIVKAGQAGQKEQVFLITYKNGVEIKRKLLRETVLRSPVAEERTFGTKIEVEVETTGRASWYAYKGCQCAAHPTFPFGRYLRVTALNTGKSVIVKINDRGPDTKVHPDRIVDLDSTVFRELAPLGAGTIEVKVELLR